MSLVGQCLICPNGPASTAKLVPYVLVAPTLPHLDRIKVNITNRQQESIRNLTEVLTEVQVIGAKGLYPDSRVGRSTFCLPSKTL